MLDPIAEELPQYLRDLRRELLAIAIHEIETDHGDDQLGDIAADAADDGAEFAGGTLHERADLGVQQVGILRYARHQVPQPGTHQRQVQNRLGNLRALGQQRGETPVHDQQLRLQQQDQPDQRHDDGRGKQQRHDGRRETTAAAERTDQTLMCRPGHERDDDRPDHRHDERLQHLERQQDQARQRGRHNHAAQPDSLGQIFHVHVISECGLQHGSSDARGRHDDEQQQARFIPAVDPGMKSAALHERVASTELDLAIVDLVDDPA